MRKLMFGILMAFGIVGVSVALPPRLVERIDGQIEYVKVVVEELERVDKRDKQNGGYSYHIGTKGERTLIAGKDFLEFAEKVKQSSEEDCDRAVRSVMSDSDNYDKYHYYVWSESFSQLGCMNLTFFVDDVKEIKKRLDRNGIKNNLPKL